jgi:hypothetical protein
MRLAAAAAMLIATTVPGFAQGIAPLRDALAKMPESLLANPAPELFNFVDIDALHALAGGDGIPLDAQVLVRPQLGGSLPALNALLVSGPDAWGEKSFIPLTDVRYFAGFGSPPSTVTIWGLDDDDAASALIEALDASDFDPIGSDGVIGNGVPMAADLLRRDTTNPWRTSVGAATFAVATDNAVIQTTNPDVLPALLAGGASLADSLVVATALGGFEAALGDDQVVQAMLISPTFGLGSIDPSIMLGPGQDMDDIRQRLEAEIAAGMTGVPLYLGGLIADIQGSTPGVMISLAYPDCGTAAMASEQMAMRWRETMPESAQGDVETSAIEAANACAAVLKISDDSGEDVANQTFNALFNAYVRGSFTVLQIGSASDPT